MSVGRLHQLRTVRVEQGLMCLFATLDRTKPERRSVHALAIPTSISPIGSRWRSLSRVSSFRGRNTSSPNHNREDSSTQIGKHASISSGHERHSTWPARRPPPRFARPAAPLRFSSPHLYANPHRLYPNRAVYDLYTLQASAAAVDTTQRHHPHPRATTTRPHGRPRPTLRRTRSSA